MLHDNALNSEIGVLVISSRMWPSASRLPVCLNLSAGPRGCLPHLPGCPCGPGITACRNLAASFEFDFSVFVSW